MEINALQGSLATAECDVIVLSIFEGTQTLSGAAKAVDDAIGGIISNFVIAKDKFEGKFAETYILQTYGKIPANKILIIGLGKQEELDLAKLREVATKVIHKCAATLKAKKICSVLHGVESLNPYECAKKIAHGTLIGTYKFDKYISSEKFDIDKFDLEAFEVVEDKGDIIGEIQRGLKEGQLIGDAVNIARDLVNEPASLATPEYLSQIAQEIIGVETQVFDEEEILEMGMGAFLAVSRGSAEEPKFIHMKYTPEGVINKKIALVGKGLTFDSGGLDLKPSKSMRTMKCDMSGAAAVLGIMSKIAEIRPNVEVHAIIAATENMPGCGAYKPGDILKAMNGKTIEVDNTDAEGRLTLADAISYAAKLDVEEIIDIATLTGACSVALGEEAAGIMGNNQELINSLITSAEKSAERFWQLPLYPEHKTAIKSPVADIKNTGGTSGGGAMTAAVFLREFISDKKWAHIDIAGPAFLDKEVRGVAKGASGITVASVIDYLVSQ